MARSSDPNRTTNKFLVDFPADVRQAVDSAAKLQSSSINSLVVEAVREKYMGGPDAMAIANITYAGSILSSYTSSQTLSPVLNQALSEVVNILSGGTKS